MLMCVAIFNKHVYTQSPILLPFHMVNLIFAITFYRGHSISSHGVLLLLSAAFGVFGNPLH